MVKVEGWYMAGIEDREESAVIGEYESVQMTGTELRDPDGRTVLHLFDGVWFDANGNGWYDWTVTSL